MKFVVAAFFLVFFQGCASVNYGAAKFDIIYVAHYHDSAEEFYHVGDYSQSATLCDYALKTLLTADRNSMKSEELDYYDKLMDSICRLRLKAARKLYPQKKDSDFPLEFNDRVEKWLVYYTGNGKVHFGKWLERSGNYVHMFKEILIANDMPEELACVPIIESGVYPFAVSKANAVGLWQFIKPTGKIFGLERNHWYDERRDPVKSTKAAAKMLKELNDRFGDWYLALAAYNCGPNRVKRAIKKQGTKNFWDLYLPGETENYVAKIIAAVMISKDPLIFGFSDDTNNKIRYEIVDVYGPVDLKRAAKCAGCGQKDLIALNPELSRQCTPPNMLPYPLKLPVGKSALFVKNFSRLSEKQKYLSKKEMRAREHRVVVYRVRRGDNLSTIARKYKVSVRKLKKWNRIARRHFIYPGQKLKIYR
ncbi:MAG: transglycosylase SLT domain-containing protein [Elusimicrobiota bacterium]|nr:transglycosylase SLT domain-containing protein [Elusimicrobiota bacterium]